MSRVLASPVKRWPGTITISDPLTLSQFITWTRATEEAEDARASSDKLSARLSESQAILRGVLACVEKWELGGGFPEQPTAENFPMTPPRAALKLIAVLTGEVTALVNEAEDPPNA